MPDEPKKPRGLLSKIPRLVLRIVWGVFLFHAAAATIVLNTNLITGLVNTWQDGHIQYKAAVSLLPGIVHLYGFELRHQDRNVQWTTRLKSVSAGLNLPKLLKHQIAIYFVHADGVQFHFGMRPTGGKAPSPKAAPFAGLPNKKPKNPHEMGGQPFGIAISGVRLRHLDHIWFNEVQFHGVAQIDGSFEIVPGTRVTVGPANFHVDSGEIEHGGNGMLKNVTMNHDVMLRDFQPDANDLNEFYFLDVHSTINADVASDEFLNYVLRKSKFIHARTGVGKLSADVYVENGIITPPTVVELKSGHVEFDLLEHELTGKVESACKVVEHEGVYEARFKLRVNDFKVTDPETKQHHLTGQQIEVHGKSTALTLQEPVSRMSLGLEVVRAKVEHLTYFNKYLPKAPGLRITAGTGELNASIESDGEGKFGHRTDRGWLKLETKGAVARYGELDLKGKVALNAKLREGVLAEKRFNIAGTNVSITDVAVQSDTPLKEEEFASRSWWGEISLTSGQFRLGTPLEANGAIAVTLQDLRPLLAIYTAKHDLPGILTGILEPGPLRATGTLALDQNIMEFKDLKVKSPEIELLGHLRFIEGDKQAVMLARYGIISVGVGRANDKTRIVINKAEDWYKKSEKFAPLSQ